MKLVMNGVGCLSLNMLTKKIDKKGKHKLSRRIFLNNLSQLITVIKMDSAVETGYFSQ